MLYATKLHTTKLHRVWWALGDDYEVNISSEENDALSVVVLEYGTVKSFAIRLRVV